MMKISTAILSFWAKNNFLIICAFIVFGYTLYARLDNINFWILPRFFHCDNSPYMNHPNHFSGIVGTNANVPNIVHYIRFGTAARCFTEYQIEALLSVIRNHRPTEIYIHTDDVRTVERCVSKIAADYSIAYDFQIRYYPQPKHAFGLNFNQRYRNQHAIDFTKLKILRRYGGIYLDNNVYVVRSLKKLLDYEMSVIVRPRPNEDIPVELRDDVIVAHRDARFLHSWLKTYHEYDDHEMKHAISPVMKTLLQKNAPYVYKEENDLPENLSPDDKSFDAVVRSKKYLFVTASKDKSRCHSYDD